MAIRSIRTLLFAVVMMLALSATSYAEVFFSVSFGPPPLPVYVQPPCPAEGYIWTPGYWSYDPDFGDYYWVPGTWVLAPEVGFFWTPGYWAWSGGSYVFYEGYWGPVVGFYGGINYGFGYFGEGFVGGRWDNGRFFYNRSVTNVNVTNIRNVYNTTIVNRTENHISFNGGEGGINARPTREQEAAVHERHIPPVAAQTQHIQAARSNPELRASANHGKPPVAATPKPGAFSGREVVAAKQAGGSWKPPANRPAPGGNRSGSESWRNVPRPSGAVHPSELPARERPAPASSGNAKQDQKYQQQQEKLYARQNQERQKLQQKQEQEHQRVDRQRADDSRRQQVEQRHQQQTQQLQQRHEQQQQKLQSRQPPERSNQSKPPKEEKPH